MKTTGVPGVGSGLTARAASIWLAAGVSAFAASAQAQTSIQLYGVIDTYVTGIFSSGRSAYGVDSGGLQVSRWGMRGSEGLGGRWKANFQLENGFNMNNGTGSVTGGMFNRQAWVGLSHENYGEFRIGQQNSVFFMFLGNIAAFYGGTYGAGLGTESGYNFRNSNDIMIATPRVAGWRAELHHALGNDAQNKANGTSSQVAVDYRGNGVYFLAGYVEARPLVSAPNAYKGVVDRQYAIGGSYDIKPFRLYLGYFKNKQSDDTINKDLYSVSAAWFITPADQLSVGYTYIDVKADAANSDAAVFPGKGHANHFGLMYLHSLSKRTTLYASAAYITNSKGLRYALGAAQAPGGNLLNRPDAGDSTTGVQFGVRHTF
ncbi:porin [Pandoraea pnomenusa]|uniref:porin n=1 Tax=Pandoraea pnomenusa TaxID=93220 RepID=UPI0011986AF9|nr:porin [Pandoraea pnomenusa]QDX20931.1 porin [Pandoraea pnomenusa]